MVVMAKPHVSRRSRTYRFPEDLIESLEAMAEENRRTVTAELEIAIEAHLRAVGKLPPRFAAESEPTKPVKKPRA